MPPQVERQAEDDGKPGEKDAFSQKLLHQPPSAAAERRTHCQLALARSRTDQQQIGDVGARNQQNEGHRAHQRHDHRTHVVHEIFVHRLDPEVPFRRSA